jgi:hypothetical protein
VRDRARHAAEHDRAQRAGAARPADQQVALYRRLGQRDGRVARDELGLAADVGGQERGGGLEAPLGALAPHDAAAGGHRQAGRDRGRGGLDRLDRIAVAVVERDADENEVAHGALSSRSRRSRRSARRGPEPDRP